jgi:glutathione S-transferase
MKLIVSLTSPYARKIRVLLAEKGIAYDQIVDIPWNAETRVPDFNPLGKVPALVADDGEVWFDSPVIAGYLEAAGRGPRMLPEDPMAAAVVRQTEALCDGILDASVAAFLETKRPAERQDTGTIARQRGKIERALAALAARVAAQRGCNGTELSLGDIAAGCALGYLDFRFAEIDWRRAHPALATLDERLFSRPSFAGTMPPAG